MPRPSKVKYNLPQKSTDSGRARAPTALTAPPKEIDPPVVDVMRRHSPYDWGILVVNDGQYEGAGYPQAHDDSHNPPRLQVVADQGSFQQGVSGPTYVYDPSNNQLRVNHGHYPPNTTPFRHPQHGNNAMLRAQHYGNIIDPRQGLEVGDCTKHGILSPHLDREERRCFEDLSICLVLYGLTVNGGPRHVPGEKKNNPAFILALMDEAKTELGVPVYMYGLGMPKAGCHMPVIWVETNDAQKVLVWTSPKFNSTFGPLNPK